jgi:hypothetical protein
VVGQLLGILDKVWLVLPAQQGPHVLLEQPAPRVRPAQLDLRVQLGQPLPLAAGLSCRFLRGSRSRA